MGLSSVAEVRAHLREKVNACCDKHGLMNRHHNLNHLFTALLEDGEKEVHDAISQALNAQEGVTGSCFIGPGMEVLFDVVL
jgi:hypothetical protein